MTSFRNVRNTVVTALCANQIWRCIAVLPSLERSLASPHGFRASEMPAIGSFRCADSFPLRAVRMGPAAATCTEQNLHTGVKSGGHAVQISHMLSTLSMPPNRGRCFLASDRTLFQPRVLWWAGWGFSRRPTTRSVLVLWSHLVRHPQLQNVGATAFRLHPKTDTAARQDRLIMCSW